MKNSGAKINPIGTQFAQKLGESALPFIYHGNGNEYGQIVEFDVSVTASECDEAQGGLGIQVASITLGVGLSGKTEDQSSVISRLKFSVPIFLPETK